MRWITTNPIYVRRILKFVSKIGTQVALIPKTSCCAWARDNISAECAVVAIKLWAWVSNSVLSNLESEAHFFCSKDNVAWIALHSVSCRSNAVWSAKTYRRVMKFVRRGWMRSHKQNTKLIKRALDYDQPNLCTTHPEICVKDWYASSNNSKTNKKHLLFRQFLE